MDLEDDMSWLTQRSPEIKATFQIMSDSEDDIMVDEGIVASGNYHVWNISNVSIEEMDFQPRVNSTQIYDGVFVEDISSDEDIDHM